MEENKKQVFKLTQKAKIRKAKIPYFYNRWGSWGLIMSLLWGFGLLSLIGMIMGIIGFLQAKRFESDAVKQRGKVRALLAIAFGLNGVLFAVYNYRAILMMTAW